MQRFALLLVLGGVLLFAACARDSLERPVSGSATATATATAPASPTATGATATATATAAVGTVTATAVPPQPPGPTSSPPAQPTATPPPAPTPIATPTPPPVAGSGVFGVVTVGPSCPVQRIDQPCPDKPYPGTLAFFDAGGREVARVTAGADGMYSVALPPGQYHVVAEPPAGRPLPRGGDADVTVTPGNWARLDMSYDSGIR